MKSVCLSIVVSLMTLIPMTVLAESNASSFSNPHWGIRATVDVSNPGDFKAGDLKISLFDPRLGFSFGGYYCAPFSNGFYFEPGVSLFYDTYGFSLSVGNEQLIDADGYIDKFGVRVPLHFGYHFDIWDKASLFVKTGPQLSVGFMSKEHLGEIDGMDGIDDYGDDLYGEEDGFNRFNLLWDIAAGFDFGNVNVSLGYDFGLLNLLKNTDGKVTFKESYFRVGIGYSF